MPSEAPERGGASMGLRRAGLVVAALWIFGLGAAYFLRHAFLFYADKGAAVRGFLESLR